MKQFDLNQEWMRCLEPQMRRLVEQSISLLEREWVEVGELREQKDYGYVVFPIAKAYEGFLKWFLFKAGLIRDYQLKSRHFRIGRSLNPDLPAKYRDEDWLFDDLERLCRRCGQEGLGAIAWEGWSKGRNRIFHYFNDNGEAVSLAEAGERIGLMLLVMERLVEVYQQVRDF